jgi:hypothetical protein
MALQKQINEKCGGPAIVADQIGHQHVDEIGIERYTHRLLL